MDTKAFWLGALASFTGGLVLSIVTNWFTREPVEAIQSTYGTRCPICGVYANTTICPDCGSYMRST